MIFFWCPTNVTPSAVNSWTVTRAAASNVVTPDLSKLSAYRDILMEASHSLTEVNCVKSTASGASGLVPLSKISVSTLLSVRFFLPFFFFFFIYIYLCRGIEGRDTMRDQRSGIDSILYYRWSDLKTRVEKCKASWSEIEKFTRFSVMRWCKKKRERDIRRFPFFRFHLGDSIIEIEFFFYYRVRGD